MRLGFLRQLLGGIRAIREQVSDAKLGRDVDHL